MNQLVALERAHPKLVAPDSPTQRVAGRPAATFETVDHAAAMLSLENAYTEDEVRAFDERVRKAMDKVKGSARVAYVAELKIDGLSIALSYGQGRLRRGVTRGDGFRGEDVTSNVRVIKAIPLRLRDGPAGPLEIRGEIYLSRRGVRADQRGARAERGRAVRESTKRRGGHDAKFGSRPGGEKGSQRLRLSARRSRESDTRSEGVGEGDGRGANEPGRHTGAARGLGAAGRAALAPLRRHRGGLGVLPRMGRPPAVPASRHRRRGDQGGRPRVARTFGCDIEVSSVGHRLQVPSRTGDHAIAADRRERWTHRGGDPVCGARTCAGGRFHGSAFDAAQRAGDRAQGSPRGRHGTGGKGWGT